MKAASSACLSLSRVDPRRQRIADLAACGEPGQIVDRALPDFANGNGLRVELSLRHALHQGAAAAFPENRPGLGETEDIRRDRLGLTIDPVGNGACRKDHGCDVFAEHVAGIAAGDKDIRADGFCGKAGHDGCGRGEGPARSRQRGNQDRRRPDHCAFAPEFHVPPRRLRPVLRIDEIFSPESDGSFPASRVRP